MEVMGSMGSGVLEYFKHTVCWHLEHSGISDVEVLVTIRLNLVHLQVSKRDLLRNPPQAGRLQPPPPYG